MLVILIINDLINEIISIKTGGTKYLIINYLKICFHLKYSYIFTLQFTPNAKNTNIIDVYIGKKNIDCKKRNIKGNLYLTFFKNIKLLNIIGAKMIKKPKNQNHTILQKTYFQLF